MSSIGDGRRPRRSCRGSPAEVSRRPRRCSREWVDRSGSTYRGGSASARGGDGENGKVSDVIFQICFGGEKDRAATRDWPGLTRAKECSLRVEGFLGATWLEATGCYRRVSRSSGRDAARRGGSHRRGSHLGRGELRLRERDDIGVADCVWPIADEGIMLAGYSKGHRRVERLKLEGWSGGRGRSGKDRSCVGV